MSKIESFPREVRRNLGMGWPFLVLGSLLITGWLALYCLFTWTFTWWFPAFFVFSYLIAHRYGTLLTREEKRVQEKDRKAVQ